jgi:hypothetical protein
MCSAFPTLVTSLAMRPKDDHCQGLDVELVDPVLCYGTGVALQVIE